MCEFKHPVAQKEQSDVGHSNTPGTYIFFKQGIRGRLFAKFSVSLNDHALWRNPRNLPVLAVSRNEMAIRIRIINGHTVALCAAKSKQKRGDVYLDDNIHHALSTKFAMDWNEKWAEPILVKLTKQEEQ